MSEVSLTIGGRDYVVACGDGEEARVAKLGQVIDEKITQIGATGGNEAQRLLFAALLLADEVGDLRDRAQAAPAEDTQLAAGLERIAQRLEQSAEAFEKAG